MLTICCLPTSHARVRWMVCLLAAASLLPAGCTRRFFRRAADRDVEEVLTEKNIYCPWQIQNWHVYPDPMARFADPFNPDRPPKPFDDPAAQYLSPNPQKPGKAGEGDAQGSGWLDLIRLWDQSNRQEPEQNTAPRPASSALPPPTKASGQDIREPLRTEQTPYLIKLEQAVELGLINSREYQDRREDLYLAALAVTLERFAFAAQFFATEQVIREYAGSLRGDAGNRWRANSGLTVRQLFPSGALLLFQFANQVVVNLSGFQGPRTITPSTINLDITQPLLRGGGKAVTLEPLTQVERNLLYVIRAYARFRKQFYVALAAGGDFTASFPNGGFIASRLVASGFAPTTGYLPTLLRAAFLNNDANNVAELERILSFFRQLQGGGDVSPLQTDQVLQQLLSSRTTVLNDQQILRDSLDQFKLQIGVPTNLPLELDDTPVRPINKQMDRLRTIFEEDRAIAAEERPLFESPSQQLRAALTRRFVELPLTRDTSFRDDILRQWDVWQKRTNEEIAAEGKRLEAERRALVQRRNELENKGQELPPAEQKRLDELDYQTDLGLLESSLRDYESRRWETEFQALPAAEQKDRAERLRVNLFRRVFATWVRLLGVAREERLAQVQRTWPELPKLCVDGVDLIDAELDQAMTVVAQAALTNRFDLMNARGQVVDAWRQVAVQANSLLGVANVQYHLDTTTPPLTTQPFAFDTRRTRNQLLFNGELPLVRRAERNNYRTALIAYQRQRRILQAAEDTVLLEVRSGLRQLRVLAENFKIQQRAIQVAYSQRDNSLETLRAPTPPGQSSAGNAAALTQQLLSAQARVPSTENQLYQIYVNYLIARLALFRDLELMPLDPRGVWIDEHATACDGPCPRPAAGPEDRVQPDRGQPERLPEPRAVEPQWKAGPR